ncbi:MULTISPECIES: tetratricopeptide repeat protein [Pseudoxanthomonas]|jgi:tetratricopeptide (TPR) repeat protein|uniref:tetratricopeptide repeat protein n=1 Tax=Pseudoxanthomonas TaxID=83618 RepID=UPI00160E1697|nr:MULTISPECIES: tetratricopeptide repeat protein [Pseudoxanthomonas]MBB3276231.1 tetratricopeptide (TPR) repeat protein [Pseudoxanthomonas sp. OG2]MBD9377702.1 tetratricopeptide repeat protein [Pseudoxanthomonas sp. PXM04]MBV7472691.1 tetratricopeptide repeat protein [Pseudoxanthomonas sp. PXM05]UBB25094.1 tetratricopeptide repeat protein [Pseudoxanthomonas japonensis]
MLHRKSRHALLSFAIIGLLGAGVAADAVAQMNRDDSSSMRRQKKEKVEIRYPEATRQEPKEKASAKMQNQLNKLFKAYEKENNEDETMTLVNEIIASDKANAYDKSVAAQIGAQAAYGKDDAKLAKDYANKVLEFNGLDNNNHYQTMFFLAQLQMQDDQFNEALATMDKFFAETKSQKPEELVVKGNILYRAERYADAIPFLKQAVEGSPEPKNEWLQILMASYAEAGQNDAAVKLAEQLAAKSPTDKKAQMNLASVYLQADKTDQAAGVLEKLRASGQLTDDREYRQLYSMYANMDGREKDVIAVINEGLQKGVLKDDYQTQLALAQSYYYSEQIPQAIEAWKKAAPQSPNGETYLNLARVLWQENRIPEAKQAAKSALDKGLKKPEDAKKILALP